MLGARRLVDFGAGNGYFASQLSRKVELPVSCVEPCSQLRTLIRDRYQLPTHASLDEVDTTEAIYTLNVLEHIDDDRAALAKMFQRIRPGGRLVIYVPAFMLLYNSNDVKVGHVRRYRRTELNAKVEGAGFHVVKSEYTDPVGFFATLAYKLIDRKKDGSICPKSLAFFDRFLFPLNRWLEPITRSLFGKNIKLVADRPGTT